MQGLHHCIPLGILSPDPIYCFDLRVLKTLKSKQSNGSREVTSLAESRDRVSGVYIYDYIP